jgi:hypothetical protein
MRALPAAVPGSIACAGLDRMGEPIVATPASAGGMLFVWDRRAAGGDRQVRRGQPRNRGPVARRAVGGPLEPIS